MNAIYIVLAGWLLTTHVLAGDAESKFAIKGAGAVSCERYVEAYKQKNNEYYSFGGWIDGYTTAFNQYNQDTFDISPWQSTQLLSGAIANYCGKNSNVNFFSAINQLLRTLVNTKLTNFSAITKIKYGTQELFIYKDVVADIQKKLNEINNTEFLEDGVFKEENENALRSFQQQQNLPLTGVPDQRTLVTLYSK